MSEATGPEALEDLPPSCVAVYFVLRETGPATVADIRESGYLEDSTARYALDRLVEADVVDTRPGPDARTTLYHLDK